LKPTPCFSIFNKHPDTQKGTIIAFTYLGSSILILILIIYFCCRKNLNEKPTKNKIINITQIQQIYHMILLKFNKLHYNLMTLKTISKNIMKLLLLIFIFFIIFT
jgi:hypothetical protein